MTPGRPRQMDDRKAVVIYLSAETKQAYQQIADLEQTSLSAVIRRSLEADVKRIKRKGEVETILKKR